MTDENWCWNKGEDHVGNRIYFLAERKTNTLRQQCHDKGNKWTGCADRVARTCQEFNTMLRNPTTVPIPAELRLVLFGPDKKTKKGAAEKQTMSQVSHRMSGNGGAKHDGSAPNREQAKIQQELHLEQQGQKFRLEAEAHAYDLQHMAKAKQVRHGQDSQSIEFRMPCFLSCMRVCMCVILSLSAHRKGRDTWSGSSRHDIDYSACFRWRKGIRWRQTFSRCNRV
jgi:hypothetical protein